MQFNNLFLDKIILYFRNMKSNDISDILDSTFNADIDNKNLKKERKLPNQENSLNLHQIKEITRFMKKSICRIDCNNRKGTGFLCQIKISNSININALITSNKVLNRNLINKGDKVNISFNNEKLKCRININKSTYVYTNEQYDITIIEITGFMYKNCFLCLCHKNRFLFLKINVKDPKQIHKNEDIVVFHYERGEEVQYSKGKLKTENSEYILNCCTTKEGSSGSPILKLEDYKVIGIHREKKTENPIWEFLLKNLLMTLLKNIKMLLKMIH